jgi:hypothetical protein
MLLSIIVSLSMATHRWLYDYANANMQGGYPGAKLIGLNIWLGYDNGAHPPIIKHYYSGHP